jgi:hypothetical protein
METKHLLLTFIHEVKKFSFAFSGAEFVVPTAEKNHALRKGDFIQQAARQTG